jgi:hypothetical protein
MELKNRTVTTYSRHKTRPKAVCYQAALVATDQMTIGTQRSVFRVPQARRAGKK